MYDITLFPFTKTKIRKRRKGKRMKNKRILNNKRDIEKK